MSGKRASTGSDGAPLRIFFYVCVDATHPGGVQTMTESLAAKLIQRGHRLSAYWSEATGTLRSDRSLMRLHLRSVGRQTMPRRLVHLPSAWRVFRALLRARPDIVHVHFVTHRIYHFLLLRRLFGYKLVLTAHGSDLLRSWPDEKPFLSRFLREADAVSTVSQDLAEAAHELSGIPRDEIAVVPNGIDIDYFAPSKAPSRDPDDQAIRLVCVGRLHPVKGQDILLEALADLTGRGYSLRLVLIGDGELRGELEKVSRKLGLGDRVSFRGDLEPDKVRCQLREADIFVLPSRSEGLPLALIEAMSCGLPCVATNVGGVPAALGSAGLIVPPEAPSDLAMAIAALSSDAKSRTRKGIEARTRALAYSSDANAERFERLYRDLVG
ncbi:glycosyltransferase family 4 protein [Qipengyuania spongiae]|uniref:Glycosyltransferase family 4 protein n=1 Tax=Qipengyuania spongiae TaxID=2909673 RepID=A0ABY5SYF9_9SPHN|nr:glycosyltransferase family 4 protein [Qipengyuania spongiae]UVI39562.1 glycosyltransferase family 4 protein [Qipengyuania spongiae]